MSPTVAAAEAFLAALGLEPLGEQAREQEEDAMDEKLARGSLPRAAVGGEPAPATCVRAGLALFS